MRHRIYANIEIERMRYRIKIKREEIMMSVLDKVIGVEEASKIIGYAAGTIKNMCAEGKIVSKKIGKTWVIDYEKLKEDFLTTKVLWAVGEGEPFTYFIDPADIQEKILLGNYAIAIENVDPRFINLKEIKEKLEKYEEENENFCKDELGDLEEFFASLGFENAEAHFTDYYGDIEHVLIYDTDSNEFYDQAEGYQVKIYEWWDGRNFQIVDEEETVWTAEVVLSREYVDLDEWDGRNFQTGGVGFHEEIYKIIEKDGERVEGEYLLVKTSQWQGNHATGEILTLTDIEVHLEQQGRDVDEYMEQIKKL